MSTKNIQRVTPNEASLSSITVNIRCPQGCPRTFANSSALRFHLAQFHQQEKVSSSQHGEVWYHCPVTSCIYHHDFGPNGKHFPKLKYLKQHYLKVHAKRSHACDCGQAFSTSALLSHHKRACGLQLLCGCGRNFSSVETLQTHARRSAHAFHPTTIQALRERRTSLSEPSVSTHQSTNNQTQTFWHHIPLKYQNVENISRGKGSVLGIMTTSSSPAISSFASVPPIFTQTTGTLLHTPSTFSPVAPVNLQQPTHLLAAIALSELAATAMKRVACVDVGVQTEENPVKRSRRKSATSDWHIEDGNITLLQNQSKRKRTAETQTRLTHRDSKRLNNSSQLQLPPNISSTIGTGKGNGHSDNDTTFLEVGSDVCNDEDESSLGSLALQVDLPEFITTQQSTSGTQTSPRAPGLTHSHLSNLTISLFDRACGDDEPGIPPPSMTSITATQTNEHLDPFATTQLLIDADEDLLGVVGDTTSITSQRAPSLGHIRSSSIETQTDHDVLLSGNAGAPDDSDEIILTTTETQTDPNSLLILSGGTACQGPGSCQVPGACQGHDSDSLWCTSETQTYEDFSDIEQFMRSTIHTQTPDHSHNELFPELSFTHTQTQTSLDDPPALVTTHTQTPKRRQLHPGIPGS
ncbi:ATM interactor-like [Penaeus indicus]|uniref:ATM interactor-like n=1 Tax=Penaeus indicus TaxID=29960 RepID=UPI00300D7F45